MQNKAKLLGLTLFAFAAIGCRSDGVDSFVSATTPVAPLESEGQWTGDPYTASGVALASGGTEPNAQYGNVVGQPNARGGSRPYPGPLNPSFDQPAKGVGNQPGEYPVEANPGTGHSNAPANQPLPGAVDDTTVRRGQ